MSCKSRQEKRSPLTAGKCKTQIPCSYSPVLNNNQSYSQIHVIKIPETVRVKVNVMVCETGSFTSLHRVFISVCLRMACTGGDTQSAGIC
jgi:hypothetical protein